jgi:hypothetical protein
MEIHKSSSESASRDIWKKDVKIVINSLLNEQYRKDRLVFLLQDLTKLNVEIDLRTRGRFRLSEHDLESDKAMFNKHLVKLRIGDDYSEWRTNTLMQVCDSESAFVLFLQEDHQFVCGIDFFEQALKEVVQSEIDVWQPSFFQEYIKNREILEKLDKSSVDEISMRGKIERDLWRSYENSEKNYLISLVGLYKRELAIKFLKVNRPYIRHYNPSSPFDFEQNQGQEWFLPIYYGLPKFELLGCIDDDLSVPGSSLVARGLFKFDHERIKPKALEVQEFKYFYNLSKIFFEIIDKDKKRYSYLRIFYLLYNGFFEAKRNRHRFAFTLLGLRSFRRRKRDFREIMQK